MKLSTKNEFYVYEHTRNDTGAIFYVGKGKRSRCSTKSSRNKYWNNIVNKANGFKFRKIAINLDNELAEFAEIERINQLKRLNVKLCNITEGGDGNTSGFKLSEETKKLISQKMLGRPSPFKGKKRPKEVGENISKAKKGKPGHKHNQSWHDKMKSVHLGSKRSEETRKKISDSKKGKSTSYMWVTNGIDNKRILKSSLLENGWKQGRTLKKNINGKFI